MKTNILEILRDFWTNNEMQNEGPLSDKDIALLQKLKYENKNKIAEFENAVKIPQNHKEAKKQKDKTIANGNHGNGEKSKKIDSNNKEKERDER